MTLAITFVDAWPIAFQQTAERVFAALVHELETDQLPVGSINLKLVDDNESQRLNRESAAHDYPTDVLTFNYSEAGEVPEQELADIALNTDMVVRQARAAGVTAEDELALLIAHGLLHVLNYDHQDDTGRATMQELQQRIVASAGYTYRELVWHD